MARQKRVRWWEDDGKGDYSPIEAIGVWLFIGTLSFMMFFVLWAATTGRLH